MYYYVKFNKKVSERVRLKFEEMVYEELKGKVEKGEEGVYDLKAILRSLEKIKSRRIMRILNENAEIIEDVGVLELKGVLENLEEEDERLIQILEEKVKTSIKKRNLHLSKSGPNYDKQNILYRSKLVNHLQSSSSILTSLNCNFSSHELITPSKPPPQKPLNYQNVEEAISNLPSINTLSNYKEALSYLVKKCKSENRGRYRLKNSIKNDSRFITAVDRFNGRDYEGWKESLGCGEFMDVIEVISHLSFFNLSISPNLFTSLISQLPERLTSKEADGLVKILHKCDDYRARREIIRKLGKEIKRRNGPSLHRYLSLNTKIVLTHLLFLHSFSIPESRPPFLKLWNTSLTPTLNSSPLQSLNLTPENVKRLGNLNAIGKYDRVYDTVLHRGHARNYRMKNLEKEQASYCKDKVEEDYRLKISKKIFNGKEVNEIVNILDNFGVETVPSPCLDIEGYPTKSNDVTPSGFFMTPDLVSSTHGKLAVCFNDKNCFYWPNDEIRLKRARETCREKWLESLGFDVIRVEWWEWGEDEERRESMLKEKLKGVGIDVEKSWWEF
ncbi:hypothetical protein TrST_g5070 [Triparma strigata]|nr:hypothetical protein TrST_g5070 [Triparma strigata]